MSEPSSRELAALNARLVRDTTIVLIVSMAAAAVIGGWWLAVAVLGGGVLAAISYRALKRGVEAIGPPAPGEEGRRSVSPTRIALGLTGRYALLLGAGYVIIGRLHLHPLGVLVGVSAVVAAATMEAVRTRR